MVHQAVTKNIRFHLLIVYLLHHLHVYIYSKSSVENNSKSFAHEKIVPVSFCLIVCCFLPLVDFLVEAFTLGFGEGCGLDEDSDIDLVLTPGDSGGLGD